jgi:hypothetical protein
MKLRLSTLALALFALLLAAPASAKDLNGRFAVGGGYTLLGNGGLLFRYNVGHIGITLLSGYMRSSTEEAVGADTGDNVRQEIDASLRVFYNVVRGTKETNFNIGGGFTYGSRSDKAANGDENDWSELGFEIILMVEHFFSNQLSLTFETGMPIRMADDDHGPAIGTLWGGSMIAPSGKGSALSFGAMPRLGASFNFYFN